MSIHAITTSDTIHSIAVRYYGNAAAWVDVVAQNQLRPPYLGRSLRDTFGQLRGTATLATPTAAGDLTIRLSAAPISLTIGDTVYCERTTATGTQIYTSTITAQDGILIEVADPLGSVFPLGHPIAIYAPAPLGRVALPGEVLIIDLQSSAVQADPVAAYGTDLHADTVGRLLLSDQGDLALVTGGANIAMQIAHRIRVDQGSLALHPTYGNAALAVIGTAPTDYHESIVQAFTAMTIADDPRITSVESVDVVRAGPALHIAIKATAATNGTPVNLSVVL